MKCMETINCPYCGGEITEFMPSKNYERHYSGACVDEGRKIMNMFYDNLELSSKIPYNPNPHL